MLRLIRRGGPALLAIAVVMALHGEALAAPDAAVSITNFQFNPATTAGPRPARLSSPGARSSTTSNDGTARRRCCRRTNTRRSLRSNRTQLKRKPPRFEGKPTLGVLRSFLINAPSGIASRILCIASRNPAGFRGFGLFRAPWRRYEDPYNCRKATHNNAKQTLKDGVEWTEVESLTPA